MIYFLVVIFRFLSWPPSDVLDFQIFKHLVTVIMANMHCGTKFYQNWSNGCGDITFNNF